MADQKGSFIVYTRSRRNTEILNIELNEFGIQCGAYHAGMDFAARSAIQEAWLKNKLQGMVATTAFGMGIDKSDVRMIIHMDLPSSLEEYVQETGRAGRDGLASSCILLSDSKSEKYAGRRLHDSLPPMEYIRKVYRQIAHYTQYAVGSEAEARFPFDLEDFCKQYRLKVIPTKTAIEWIAKLGYIGYTEKFLSKTRVWVIADREVWQELDNLPFGARKVFQAILRLYEGVLFTMTPIDEKAIADQAQLRESEVPVALVQLAKYELIQFEPKGEIGQIWFSSERLHSDNLDLEESRYQAVKENKLYQWKLILQYFHTQECRQQFMARYFDEVLEKCGICDNCINGQSDAKVIRDKILERTNAPVPLDQVVNSFHLSERKKVLKELIRLEKEHIVMVSDDKMVSQRSR